MKRSDIKKFIQTLSADEAVRVLKEMLDYDPSLIKKAYEIAVKAAGDVNADAIMIDVFESLNRLDYDDLNGRAGRTRYGYVDPSDATWELFEEALDPFIDDLNPQKVTCA